MCVHGLSRSKRSVSPLRYPCKTLAGERQVKKEVQREVADAVLLEDVPQGKAAKAKAKAKAKQEAVKEDLGDGYSRSIYVKQHAFCCRIMKKGRVKFDRIRSDNWFRSMLSGCFPEIAALPLLKGHEDNDFVKQVFLSRCMNISHGICLEDKEFLGDQKARHRLVSLFS